MSRWIPNLRERFVFLGVRSKRILLVLATAFLMAKFYFFIIQLLLPTFKAIKKVDEFIQVNCLIYFDILFNLTLFCCGLFFFFLFAGTFTGKKIAIKIVGRRPLVVFAVTAAFVLTVLLIIAGTNPMKHMSLRNFNLDTVHEFIRILLPNHLFVKHALLASLCFGLVFADELAVPEKRRWWLIPFSLIPAGVFNFFPLLWYSFFSWWMPSKYWAIWRIPTAFISCFLILLFFPLVQPIKNAMPTYNRGYVQNLQVTGDGAYSGYFNPATDELLITNSSRLRKYKREQNGKYTHSEMLYLPFLWNEASLDFDDGKGYFHDINTSQLYVVDIEKMSILDIIKIPVESFLVQSPYLHQVIDNKRKRLVVADYYGSLYSMNLDTMLLDKSVLIKAKDENTQIMADPKTGLLYVLYNNEMKILDINDLKVIGSKSLTDRAEGIYTSADLDEVYISFPKAMKVRAYDKETLDEKMVFNAPAGVRKIAVNPDQNLLFESSISGVVELRELDTGKLLKRKRMVAWAHWLEVIPQYRQVLITGGDTDSVIWDYEADNEWIKASEWTFYQFEKILRWVLNDLSK